MQISELGLSTGSGSSKLYQAGSVLSELVDSNGDSALVFAAETVLTGSGVYDSFEPEYLDGYTVGEILHRAVYGGGARFRIETWVVNGALTTLESAVTAQVSVNNPAWIALLNEGTSFTAVLGSYASGIAAALVLGKIVVIVLEQTSEEEEKNKSEVNNMSTQLITGVFAQGDARYYARAKVKVDAAITDQKLIEMMQALEGISYGKCISVQKSIFFDDTAIPESSASTVEMRYKLLIEFGADEVSVLEIPLGTDHDQTVDTWFAANKTKLYNAFGNTATKLISVNETPERKARGR